MSDAQIEVELQEHMGSDASIANAAWTSTYDLVKREAKYDEPAKVADIVRRCVREGHSVPLESVVMRFWFRWPVHVDRQHMTHRMASHNGLSGRYRTLPTDYMGLPDDVKTVFAKAGLSSFVGAFDRVCVDARHMYSLALTELRTAESNGLISNPEFKRAREEYRAVLGTAFMVERTTIFNLLSFANWQRLRNSGHAHPKIREAAQKALAAVVKAGIAPIAIGALMDVGWTTSGPNHEWHEWESDH